MGMWRSRLCIAVATVVLSPGLSVQAAGETVPTFHLCASNIASTGTIDRGRLSAVAVQLNPEGTEAFADFTGRHIGRRVEIVAGNSTLVSAAARVTIADGRIVGAPMDPGEAVALATRLREAPPGGPCGTGP